MNKLKLGTDCSGIGSPETALKMIGIDHEVVFMCEKDKHAQQTWKANHAAKYYFDDMTTRDNSPEDLYSDLYIAGIPCQSFSLAGKRLGESDARGTLFYNFYDYVKKRQPKVFIIENVKGLLSDKKGKTFRNWLELLAQTINGQEQLYLNPDSLMYNVHHTVLNSKDFGVPQNRERVFIVGIRSDLPNTFRFPNGYPLNFLLKDILEPSVAEKYYLSDAAINRLLVNRIYSQVKINPDITGTINTKNNSGQLSSDSGTTLITDDFNKIVTNNNGELQEQKIFNCIDANYHKGMDNHAQRSMIVHTNNEETVSDIIKTGEEIIIHSLHPRSSKTGKGGTGPLSRNDGLTYCIGTQTIPAVELRDKSDLLIKVDEEPYIINRSEQRLTGKLTKKQIVPTLKSETRSGDSESNVVIGTKIRRLTPLECFRLQGYPDNFIKPVSDTQLYRQAGNSITVNVMMDIIRNLLPILQYGN